MNRSKEPSLADRQSAAAAARKGALERHRAMANNPALDERQAAREGIITARKARAAEREPARGRDVAEREAQEAGELAARETALQASHRAARIAFAAAEPAFPGRRWQSRLSP